jgi:hypothetical protein
MGLSGTATGDTETPQATKPVMEEKRVAKSCSHDVMAAAPPASTMAQVSLRARGVASGVLSLWPGLNNDTSIVRASISPGLSLDLPVRKLKSPVGAYQRFTPAAWQCLNSSFTLGTIKAVES